MKWFLLLFLLLIPFTSATIFSINSGGNDQLVMNPNQFIEGFVFANFTEPIPVPPPLGGGGSGVLPGVIFLDFILINSSEFWKFNVNNKITIRTLDNNENLIDIDTLDIIIDEGLGVIGNIIKFDDGIYNGTFFVGNEEITNLTIIFNAAKGDVSVNETLEVELIPKEAKPRKTIKERIDDFKFEFYYIIIFFLMIIILGILLAKRYRDKNK